MPRAAEPVKTGLTFEEYLEFEKKNSEKHEFVDGQLFMMAGGSIRHNRLTLCLSRATSGCGNRNMPHLHG